MTPTRTVQTLVDLVEAQSGYPVVVHAEATLGTMATLFAVLYVPYLRILFQFSVLHLNDLAVALVLGSVSITWFEVLKLVRRARGQPASRMPNA